MENPEHKNTEEVPRKSPFDDLTREELISKCKGLLVLAQKAKQAKSEYQLEVDKYKSQIIQCENEKKGFLNSLKTLQELVDSLTEQKLNYITKIDTLQSQQKSFEDKCNTYKEEVKKNKADLLVRDQKLAISLQKISDLDSEIVSLKRQNSRLEEENEQLINQLTELETRASEFNNIGLQQREQLQLLELKIQDDSTYKNKIDDLNSKIRELNDDLDKATTEFHNKDAENKLKIDELTSLYDNEKFQKDKAIIKLKSYRDKILKCASCINQLKNARFILTKTIKEYSENIPKWQNEIMKASKILDEQMNVLNQENLSLKRRIEKLEVQLSEVNKTQNNSKVHISEINTLQNEKHLLKEDIVMLKQEMKDLNDHNIKLKTEITELTSMYEKLKNVTLDEKNSEIKSLKEEINVKISEVDKLSKELGELNIILHYLKVENENLNISKDNNTIESLILQVKALESEKSILVKEKLNVKDNFIELENHNKNLSSENDKIKQKLDNIKLQFESISKENNELKEKALKEKDEELKHLQIKITESQEKYEHLKKDFESLQVMNGLLSEEIGTLKLSLEQPKDDTDNFNESLQTDIFKLETKLLAYKQENASLLTELKECQGKVKEYDNIVVEYEDAKSKLLSYKTENNELLIEMKEINQALKERGEAITKLQKAVSEMENLIESLEKDRDERNGELIKKINILEDNLKTAVLHSNKSNEDKAQLITERENAFKLLKEKELAIATLKDELERLKQSSCNAIELPNEDMSTSTISKAEEHSRMKDLDETFEDKYTKLRIFALKLKKKLNDTTSQLHISDQENLKLKKLLEEQEGQDKLKSNKDEVDSINREVQKDNKAEISEFESKIKILSSDVERLQAELTQKKEQLTAEINAHTSTKQQLEKSLRDVKKKNVLSLEMEDYEKSMKELTSKMEEKKKKIVQMESTIDSQEGTITAMKTQIKLLEEQIKAEETQNRLLKEELQRVIQESKEKDNIINAKKEIITKLVYDLEDEKRKNEEADLEMTSLLSEKEKIIMNFGEERIELNNKMKRLEFKVAELNEKLRITNMELADLKTEYTSYKVRAQAVLRQNQTIDHSQEELLKEETAALKAQTENLNLKLKTLEDTNAEQSAELEATRKRAAESGAEASRAQQRTARLQSDLTRLSQQLESERIQHKLQISTLTQCYKSQISDLEIKLQKETDNLRKQLVSVQERAESSKAEENLNRDKYLMSAISKDDANDGEMDINVSLIPREEGEGSESAPSPPLSKSFLTGSGRRSPVPLERLLEEGVPEEEALDTASLSFTPEQEIADLKRKVLTLQQRVKHVTVLLSESERECARMSQLSELLKSELRRVRGAAQHAHNTEYMKNVTLKFLTLPPGDERSRLVPVLQKILTLSSEESQKIQAVAKGLDPNPSKSWGSYLPWPGGK